MNINFVLTNSYAHFPVEFLLVPEFRLHNPCVFFARSSLKKLFFQVTGFTAAVFFVSSRDHQKIHFRFPANFGTQIITSTRVVKATQEMAALYVCAQLVKLCARARRRPLSASRELVEIQPVDSSWAGNRKVWWVWKSFRRFVAMKKCIPRGWFLPVEKWVKQVRERENIGKRRILYVMGSG